MLDQDASRTSFYWIVLISAVFFAGYFLLKCPLAFILHRQHIPLLKAYSITTTANILMAIVSVILGVLLRNNNNQKFLLFLGVLLSSVSLVLLKSFSFPILLLGVGLYVIGGSLYFFNIIIYINKILSSPKQRQEGNYKYQIWVNAGALVGGILFIMEYNNDRLLNEYSVIACVFSLILFAMVYKRLFDEKIHFRQTWTLLLKLVCVLALVLVCLMFDFATRWIALLAFVTATGYGIYHAYKTHNTNYLNLIFLVLFFSVPYWLGYTILYNEFFHLLDKNSYHFFGMQSDSVILLDPIVNVVFGICILKLYQKYTYKMQIDLILGIVLLGISFLLLFFGLLLATTPQKLLLIYPILAVLVFSCGEFLIQSTLNASVKNLLTNSENISFGMGILRSSRASASAIGFFFMWLTVRDGLFEKDAISHQEPKLYMLTAGYIFLSLFAYLVVKKVLKPVC